MVGMEYMCWRVNEQLHNSIGSCPNVDQTLCMNYFLGDKCKIGHEIKL